MAKTQTNNKRKTAKKAKADGIIKRKVYSGKGRPTLYSDAFADELCERIATTKDSLVKILANNPLYPSYRIIMQWLDDGNHTYFAHNYARARKHQSDYMFEDIIDMVNEAKEDVLTRKVSASKASAFMAGVRIQTDAMKFYISKVQPKKYGEKLDVTTNGEAIQIPVSWKPTMPANDNG